jgi:hypothetical protein
MEGIGKMKGILNGAKLNSGSTKFLQGLSNLTLQVNFEVLSYAPNPNSKKQIQYVTLNI